MNTESYVTRMLECLMHWGLIDNLQKVSPYKMIIQFDLLLFIILLTLQTIKVHYQTLKMRCLYIFYCYNIQQIETLWFVKQIDSWLPNTNIDLFKFCLLRFRSFNIIYSNLRPVQMYKPHAIVSFMLTFN